MAPWDVFLSHSSKDKPRARVLRDALESQGVTVWFDEDQIRPGDSIPLKVEEGIELSEVVILCLSPAFLESEWTPAERAAFMYSDPSSKKRKVLPVLFENCGVPKSLAHIRHVDYRTPSDAGIQQLLDSLTAPLMGVSQPISPAPRGNPSGDHRPPPRHENVDVADAELEVGDGSVGFLRSEIAVGLQRCPASVQMLLVADLDGFTNINQTYGLAAGDRLVEVIDAAVKDWAASMVANASVVSAAVTRGRDEWFILLASNDLLNDAPDRLSVRLRDIDFARIVPSLFVTACIGFAVRHSDEAAITLMRRALAGMQQAKRKGTGRISEGPFTVKPLANASLEEIEVGWLVSSSQAYSVRVRPNYSYGTNGPALFGEVSPWPPN